MNSKYTFSFAVAIAILLSACSARPLDASANQIIVTNDKPPQSCKFIKQISGHQGNWFTGGWTSNKNIQQGSFNMLRNEAAKSGANYVQLINSNQSWNSSSSSGKEVGMQFLGNAYHCPQQSIGL